MDSNRLVNEQGKIATNDDSNGPNKRSSQGSLGPVKNSDNTKDLNAIEFNTAEEVRNAMKGVMSGTVPSNFNEDDSEIRHRTPPRDSGDKDETKAENKAMVSKIISKTIQISDQVLVGKSPPAGKTVPVKRLGKRRGQKKKAKKSRLAHFDSIYVGKLSNLMTFRNRRHRRINYETESELDSIFSSS